MMQEYGYGEHTEQDYGPPQHVQSNDPTEVAPPDEIPPVYAQPGSVRPGDVTEMMPDEEYVGESQAWLIVVSEGGQYGEMLRLHGKAITIGRGNDCEIVLNDGALSRQHAKIRVERSGDKTEFVIHDLATSNGTFVNGTKQQSVKLNNGDSIRLGRTELVFKRLA